jgi:hypothetical protein
MLDTLQTFSNVVLFPTGVTGPVNMVHRFFAIDEPDVDLMMVRDADSRIHWKDRWAIQSFLEHPDSVAHTIRDNIAHSAVLMGGLWGLRKSAGLNVRSIYSDFKDDSWLDQPRGHDQYFLKFRIYPEIKSRLLVHYSNGRLLEGEFGIEFPFRWSKELFCGQVHGEISEEKKVFAGTIVNFLHKR